MHAQPSEDGVGWRSGADLHKEVCQAGEQVLLGSLIAAALGVLQDPPPERLAEVEGLQHRIGIASVPKVLQAKVPLRLCHHRYESIKSPGETDKEDTTNGQVFAGPESVKILTQCGRLPGNSLRAFSSLLEVTPMLETLLHRLPRSSSGSNLGRYTLGGIQNLSMGSAFCTS